MAEGFRLCIRYAVRDRLAYLSHLETVEAMRRVVRRAQLPYAVSEGFSPHMKATFGPALPVGAGGEGEYFDVRLTEYVDPDEALERLKASAPVNLVPLEAEYIDLRSPALDVAFPISAWHAEFAGGDDASAVQVQLEESFGKLMKLGYIETVKVKRGKTRVKRVEFSRRIVKAPLFALSGSNVAMEFSTFQDNDGALRPDKFIEAALKDEGNSPQLVSLMRTELSKDTREDAV